jgi:hypothetical protein
MTRFHELRSIGSADTPVPGRSLSRRARALQEGRSVAPRLYGHNTRMFSEIRR